MSVHGAEQSTDDANSAPLGTAKVVQDDVKQTVSTPVQSVAVGPASQALSQPSPAVGAPLSAGK